jgi:hypothetical protein
MKKMEISEKNIKMDKKSICNAVLNWKSVLEGMLPETTAKKMIHSIQEIFEMNETTFKAYTVFKILPEMPGVHGKRDELIKVLKAAMSTEGETTFEPVSVDDSDIFISDDHMKLFQKHNIRILERLLPLRAHQLRTAVETIFKKEQVLKMAATYHIIQRYMTYGLTSMVALIKLLEDEKLINSTEHLLTGSEELSLVHPSVTFELKYDMNGKNNEKEIRKALTDALNAVQTEENLILWLNQEYKRKASAYNWDPLDTPVTKEDLDNLSVSVEDIWYGNLYHEKVRIDFNYEKFDNDSQIEDKERDRLQQLTNFFHLALDKMYQIVPTEGVFKFVGKTWQSDQKLPEAQVAKSIECKVKALWHGMEQDLEMRRDAASLFQSLGDSEVHFNTAQKILDLLKTDADVDNLTITIQAIPDCTTNMIDCGPVFINPERKQRFKDLPENLLIKVLELMTEKIVDSKLHKELFDIIVNLNKPMLFTLKERNELRQESFPQSDGPRSKLQMILEKYRDVNGTIGNLMDGFDAIKMKFPEEEETVEAMTELVAGLEDILKEAAQLSKEQSKKQYANKNTLDNLCTFLKDHQPDGMKKYAEIHGRTIDKFLGLVDKETVIPGDMIFFFRKNWSVEYAHAAIYTPAKLDQSAVHVQSKNKKTSLFESEVRCDDIKQILKKKDKVFYVRACENRKDQEKVLSRVEACLYPNPIEYDYNGRFGSCQTFCTKIYGAQSLTILNPEAFLTSMTGIKRIIGKKFGGKALALLHLMDARFGNMLPEDQVDLGSGDDNIMIKACPAMCSLRRGRISRFNSVATEADISYERNSSLP